MGGGSALANAVLSGGAAQGRGSTGREQSAATPPTQPDCAPHLIACGDWACCACARFAHLAEWGRLQLFSPVPCRGVELKYVVFAREGC